VVSKEVKPLIKKVEEEEKFTPIDPNEVLKVSKDSSESGAHSR